MPSRALHRYLLAFAIIALTLLVRTLMSPLWETSAPFALFMIATVAAAWWAGPGPGMLVGIGSLAIRGYYDSTGALDLRPSSLEAMRLVLFAAFVAGTVLVLHRMRCSARTLDETLATARLEIAERQRTETALRESQRELQLVIEEQERTHEMLLAARRNAEEANRLKDDFLALVSHELRTPLNAILGWTWLLRSDMVPAGRTTHAFDVIERNARAQAQLIADLLDVARSHSGRLHLEPHSMNLAEAVDAAIAGIGAAAKAKSVRLVAAVHRPLPVWGDPLRLEQVFWNLLSNAIKFTPAGGVVEIEAREIEGAARVRVTDTGAGIDPAFLPRVFDRFAQANGGMTRSHGGLGLGLSLVRHLVELHRGTISADSDGPARGSSFIVLLPLHRSERDPDDAPPVDREAPPVHRAAKRA